MDVEVQEENDDDKLNDAQQSKYITFSLRLDLVCRKVAEFSALFVV